MDDATRRLLALLRKIRIDVHKSITELESCDPDHEQYDSNSSSEKPESDSEAFAAIKAIRIEQESARQRNIPSIIEGIGWNGKASEWLRSEPSC